MKKFKRIPALLAALCLAASLVPAAAADGETAEETTDGTIITASAFTDVAESDYFFAPVEWAVANGVTVGTSASEFSPDETCTRAQIITFLWRAVGAPEPATASSFTDVDSEQYYYKAVQWAHETGVDKSVETFSPDEPCTRAAVVEFLWLLAGSPAAAVETAFTDVTAESSYALAVAWAVEQGITTGVTETTFAPDDTCTRAQIVTFLYRAFA
ncbi:MAG: S-layer homology domain-containing protein [Oscillospiraceae bacterium]|nr:S-layer homology domain-containing protein [Oscillospiraceae bacterium]